MRRSTRLAKFRSSNTARCASRPSADAKPQGRRFSVLLRSFFCHLLSDSPVLWREHVFAVDIHLIAPGDVPNPEPVLPECGHSCGPLASKRRYLVTTICCRSPMTAVRQANSQRQFVSAVRQSSPSLQNGLWYLNAC